MGVKEGRLVIDALAGFRENGGNGYKQNQSLVANHRRLPPLNLFRRPSFAATECLILLLFHPSRCSYLDGFEGFERFALFARAVILSFQPQSITAEVNEKPSMESCFAW